MKQAVVCIAPDVAEAEREVTSLREAGFSTDDISVLWPDLAGAQELGYEQHTRAPEGIATGTFIGALLGGVVAYLAFSRFIVTPFSIDLINAGRAMALLSGVGAGSIVGFVLGGLIGLAFPLYEAKKYERKIKIGSTLVAVHTDSADEAKQAEMALKRTGAMGIHHIEETTRCKAKACDAKKVAGTTAAALVALGIAFSAAQAAPISPVPMSPAAKVDDQKAKMPADVTTKEVPANVQPGDMPPLPERAATPSVKSKVLIKSKHKAN